MGWGQSSPSHPEHDKVQPVPAEPILGNETNLREAAAKGSAANRAGADAFAANVLPVVRQIQASGQPPSGRSRRLEMRGASARHAGEPGMTARCGTSLPGRCRCATVAERAVQTRRAQGCRKGEATCKETLAVIALPRVTGEPPEKYAED